MRILVTGASGYIGGRMVKALCEKDWVEKVVGTDITEPTQKLPKFDFIQKDVREPMDDLFKNEKIDTVVHAAYAVTPRHDKNMMEDINKRGTRNVLAAVSKAGVKQFMITSSTMAYGFYPDNDTPLTEESPLRGNDDFTYAKNKKEIEKIMQGFIAEHPEIMVTILRPCFVIGPAINNPFSRHLRKKFVLMPYNTQPFQYVHEDDLINVMILLIEKKIDGIYNVTADGTMTFSEMIKRLGNIRIPVPWPLIYISNNLAWFLRLTFISEFPSPGMRLMVNPWLASSEKLKQKTGYCFKYNTKEAFEDFAGSVA
ncbi:MAG: NAD-dependent epimerase/dehydratase family protein [Deltaproteobacteria bacterium]|nr:NAD-dependent epimerase/dehydratase family protein [Deltaproteobacteria bacterium]